MKTDREISHLIATEMLGWGYAESSDTYWLDFGVQVGLATSFNPLTDELQGNKVISVLNLPCTRENFKEYVLSLTKEQKKEICNKYRKEYVDKIYVLNKGEKMEGKLVSEEETAKGLGFRDVTEFRRWQTVAGRELEETKFALKKAKDEAQRFWWHLKRSQVVLDKAKELIGKPQVNISASKEDKELAKKVLFAIDVISNKQVDWDNELHDWLEPINEELRKLPSPWSEK